MRFGRFYYQNCEVFGALGDDGKTVILARDEDKQAMGIDRFPLEAARTLVPVFPTKIVGIGLNYRAHAAEMGKPLPDEPLMFLKPATAVIGPGEAIQLTKQSDRVDYEGELAVVIGQRCRDVSAADALRYVLGFTCCNDVTARDLQKKDVQYTRAKGFDTFAPVGPYLVTELDTANLQLETYVNGVQKQASTTADMIFDVPTLIAFVSSVMTLLPGDIITTGTPSGIGPLKRGDTVEVRIEGIGSLVNPVV
jgi:2-keto-4-pentenoate hydratase/2-oxohepta-3-ene-1,7-dioic acid hydratase in catechol pathway